MVYNVVIYILNIVTTYVLMSSIIALIFVKFDKKKIFTIEETLIYSAALGPVSVSLFLYYLLLLLPHNSSFFYFVFVHLIFLGLLVAFRSSFLQLQNRFLTRFRKIKWDNKILFCTGIITALIFIAVWQHSVITIPVLRHDTFEYASWGKDISQSKIIEYKEVNYDSTSGFFYVARHGLFFPLFVTWGSIYNDIFGAHSDYYFRSITGWYWGLILLLIFYWLSKRDKVVALIACISLTLTPAFSASLLYYHLDTYRIFFLLATLAVLMHAIKSNEKISIIVFGILGGFMANTHSIGALLVPILYTVYFIFAKAKFTEKITNLILAGIIIMACGGIQYLLDTLIGTGWIL